MDLDLRLGEVYRLALPARHPCTAAAATGYPCGSAGLRLAPATTGGVACRTAPAWQRAAEVSREQPIPAWEEQHPLGWPMGRGAASPPCGDMELMGRSGILVFR